MPDTCPCCDDELQVESNSLKCVECGYFYHLGACSGVTDETFKSKREFWRNSWRCQTCQTAKSRGSQSGKQKQDDCNIAAVLATINRKLDSLVTLQDTVSAIEQSVNLMSAKYDEVLLHMRQQDGEIKDLKKRVANIEKREKDVNLIQMQQDMNALEWQTRKMNLEIHGIAVSERENLLSKINQMADKLGVPELSESDVVAVHRLPARPEKIPGIIVRFAKQATREQWFDKRKTLNRTDEDGYILENMTKQNRALLWSAREWARQSNYRYCWHRNGKIFLRRKDGDGVILIKSEADFERLN